MPNMEIVYVIRACETNLWKVGRTQSSPEQRIKSLQVGCPHKLELYDEIRAHRPGLESVMHDILNNRAENKQGEWFKAKPKTIDKAVEVAVLHGVPMSLWPQIYDKLSEHEQKRFDRWRGRLWEHADSLKSEAFHLAPSDEITAEWVKNNAEWIAEKLRRLSDQSAKVYKAVSYIPSFWN